jgi:uncharacterized protein (DUF433 family)
LDQKWAGSSGSPNGSWQGFGDLIRRPNLDEGYRRPESLWSDLADNLPGGGLAEGIHRHERPFATDAVWTARQEVFARFRDLIVSTSRHGQLAMDIIDEYLIPVSGLAFEQGVASTWQPQKLVILNPDIQFGAPCITGTRIPTRAVWGMRQAGDPSALIERAYKISPEELNAALAWEEALAAAA